jgi:hypothetical protein
MASYTWDPLALGPYGMAMQVQNLPIVAAPVQATAVVMHQPAPAEQRRPGAVQKTPAKWMQLAYYLVSEQHTTAVKQGLPAGGEKVYFNRVYQAWLQADHTWAINPASALAQNNETFKGGWLLMEMVRARPPSPAPQFCTLSPRALDVRGRRRSSARRPRPAATAATSPAPARRRSR